IKLCTSAADVKIRLFTCNLQDKNECKVLEGQPDFMNNLVLHPKQAMKLQVKLLSNLAFYCPVTLKRLALITWSKHTYFRWSAISENLFAATGYPT
ncbi:hypothetical protein A6R68_17690, partial [Neotoma lepida]